MRRRGLHFAKATGQERFRDSTCEGIIEVERVTMMIWMLVVVAVCHFVAWFVWENTLTRYRLSEDLQKLETSGERVETRTDPDGVEWVRFDWMRLANANSIRHYRESRCIHWISIGWLHLIMVASLIESGLPDLTSTSTPLSVYLYFPGYLLWLCCDANEF